jgi:hypothetical protein
MSNGQHIYSISIHIGIRKNADESKTIDPVHKAAWLAVSRLPARIYNVPIKIEEQVKKQADGKYKGTGSARNISAVVSANWAAAQRYALAVYDESENPDIEPLVKIKVSSNSRRFPQDTFARWYCGDVFVAMNLAAPGCCSIFVDKSDSFPFPASLYGDGFDLAWIESSQEGWPSIQGVRLEAVWAWVSRIRHTGNSVAQSPLEQVLFCLLRTGLGMFSGPDTLIWLAHAIEAIYGRPSPPFSVLRERIAALLDISELNQRSLTLVPYGVRSCILVCPDELLS